MRFNKNSIVFLVVFMLMSMCSFVNASNEDKFMELLTKEQEVVEIFEELQKNTFKTKQIKGQFVYDIHDMIEDETSVAIKKVLVDFDMVKENKNESMLFSLNLNDVDFVKGEVIAMNKLYALNLEEITDGMIGIKNQDLDKLAKKFGMPEEEIDEFKEILKTESQLSKNQTKKLLKIYEKAAEKAIKNNVKIEKNVKFIDDGNEYLTNKYTATIDIEAGVEFLIEFFEEIKKNKTLYNIMIDNLKDDIGVDRKEAVAEFNELVDDLKEVRKELKKKDGAITNEELFKISLYERNGKTVVTELNMQEEEIIRFKAFNEVETDILELEVNDKSIGEDMHLRLVLRQSNEKIDLTFRVYGTEVSVDYVFDENFNYTIKEEKIQHDIELIKLVMNLSDKADRKINTINRKNTFILNDEPIEKIEEKLMQIESNLMKFEDKMEMILDGYENPTVARANYAAFLMEFSDMKMEFIIKTADIHQLAGIHGIYVLDDKCVVAAAIGETDIHKIEKINTNNYFVKLSDVLPEYELPEQLKDEMVCKITNEKLVSERFGEMYVDKTGNKIYLRNPYKYFDELYISDYDVVTLKE